MPPIIELKQLTKVYGDKTAVHKLDLTIEAGEVYGLLGPNGAGKSTTILMMLGLSEPTSGSVMVTGIDSTRNPIEVKKKVGYLPDDVGFYDDMSGLDNLIYTARLNRIPENEAITRAERLLERVGLKEAGHRKAGTYSRGMRQRLGLADVLIKHPQVIILDEPTLGLDPQGVKELLNLIRQLSRDEGITVLLSSHHLHQVQQICDRVGIFVDGKLLASGPIDTLAAQLFDQHSHLTQFKADPITEDLISALKQLEGVIDVEQQETHCIVKALRNVNADISHTIMMHQSSLLEMIPKQVGLDEIYHRYFEGKIAT